MMEDVTPLVTRGVADQAVQIVYCAEDGAIALRYVLDAFDGLRIVEIASAAEMAEGIADLIMQMNALDLDVTFADPLGLCAGLRLSHLVVTDIALNPVTMGEVQRALAQMRTRKRHIARLSHPVALRTLADELFA